MILRRVTALRLHDTAAMRLHETAAILRLEMAAMLRRYDTAARFGCMLQQRYRGSIRRRVAATWYGSDTEARYGGALQRHDTAAIPRTGGGDKRRMRREGQAASVRAATRRRGGGDRRRICMPLHNKRTSGAADRSPCRQTDGADHKPIWCRNAPTDVAGTVTSGRYGEDRCLHVPCIAGQQAAACVV